MCEDFVNFKIKFKNIKFLLQDLSLNGNIKIFHAKKNKPNLKHLGLIFIKNYRKNSTSFYTVCTDICNMVNLGKLCV